MEKLPKILCLSLVGLFAFAGSAAQAQTSQGLPPWVYKNPQPAPAPQPAPQPNDQRTIPGVIINDPRPVIVDRGDDRYYGSRKGHPHGMPPGQAKKLGYRANPSNGGLPPGQAKKMGGYYKDYRGDDRYDKDRRYEDRRDDDHGKGHGKGHGKH